MDPCVIDLLRHLNSEFYRRCAPSFSSTRQAPWEGWLACLPYLREACRDGESSADGGSASSRDRGASAGGCSASGRDRETSARGCDGGACGRALDLVDVACGNGRFEAFVSEELAGVDVHAAAVDDCDALMADARGSGATFARFDALAALVGGLPWREGIRRALASPCDGSGSPPRVAVPSPGPAASPSEQAPPPCAGPSPGPSSPSRGAGFDAAVSFGFLHHVPSRALRERALAELIGLVRPGGIVVVSLWRFLEDDRLARKAERSHAEALAALALLAGRRCGVDLAAELEEGDRFLGWQDATGLWRYCHSFDEDEVDRLAAAVANGAEEAARFRSDGKTGRLNTYLIFRKH